METFKQFLAETPDIGHNRGEEEDIYPQDRSKPWHTKTNPKVIKVKPWTKDRANQYVGINDKHSKMLQAVTGQSVYDRKLPYHDDRQGYKIIKEDLNEAKKTLAGETRALPTVTHHSQIKDLGWAGNHFADHHLFTAVGNYIAHPKTPMIDKKKALAAQSEHGMGEKEDYRKTSDADVHEYIKMHNDEKAKQPN